MEMPSAPVPLAVMAERPVIIRLPDQTLMAVSMPDPGQDVVARASADNGATWSDTRVLLHLADGPWGWAGLEALADQDGEVHLFLLNDAGTGVIRTGEGQHVESMPRKRLDIWHSRSRGRGQSWAEPRCLWQGYTGALNSVVQLSSGRILLPFAHLTDRTWVRRGQGLETYTFVGQYDSTALYSDDQGATWQLSSTPLRVPAPDITYAYGAVEPVVVERADGLVWMLIRTQMGRFYESFSANGASWTTPRPSAILSSDSPAGLVRMEDGQIVLFWNNCLRHPYAYGGRQVLHAAVSTDQGRTWQGFREVARDPRRDEPPPSSGDHGTAYPFPCLVNQGKIAFATGQGEGRALTSLLDPEWLRGKTQECDFSAGLEEWSIFGTHGVELVPHPSRTGARVLQVRKPEEGWPAAAVWNFPMGARGRLRPLPRPGCGDLLLGLTDHFSPPFDLEDHYHNLYNLQLGAGGVKLVPGTWQWLRLDWDGDRRRCLVFLGGRRAAVLPLLRASPGACYLRLRAAAESIDPEGFLVEKVEVEVC
jgi:hypothetical protein